VLGLSRLPQHFLLTFAYPDLDALGLAA